MSAKIIGQVGILSDVIEYEIGCADHVENDDYDAIITRLEQRNNNIAQRSSDVIEATIQRPRRHDHRAHIPWHVTGTSQINPHITDVWERGVSGSGSVVAIVDDGCAWNHPDLRQQYIGNLSINLNYGRAQSDPRPTGGASHGTNAAGVALASGNGCVMGVAPNASLAAIRLIAAPVTDADEARGLSHKLREIDVFSCSWGPPDDGITLGSCGPHATNAMMRGWLEMFTGYIWAAGNGADVGDNCAYDGYCQHPATIVVGAITNNGRAAYYSESCPALWVVAPSSGDYHNQRITTTHPNSNCVHDFGGTSAAAPFVAGVYALIHEVNPTLRPWDISRIIARTATPIDISDSSWLTNAAGIRHSPKYGFGLINAAQAVAIATTHSLSRSAPLRTIWTPALGPTLFSATIRSIVVVELDALVYKVRVSNIIVHHNNRGVLVYTLCTPNNTCSSTLPRPRDVALDLIDWSFAYSGFLDEQTRGSWSLTITDPTQHAPHIFGELVSWSLELWSL